MLTFYNTINMLQTIEDFLGLQHLGMNDANAKPMADLLTTKPDLTPYDFVVPGVLCQPPVNPDLVPECNQPGALRTRAVTPLHDGAWWAQQTRQFNFRRPDALDSAAFNGLLWRGVKAEDKPYPSRSVPVAFKDEDNPKEQGTTALR